MLKRPRKFVITILVLVASILPLAYVGFPAIASTPKQFGLVDIYTNRGGQGPNEFGGSFMVGETIGIYMYSSFDGVAVLTVQEPDGTVYNSEPFYIYAGQVAYLSSTASNPPGTSELYLQVCPTESPTVTETTPTIFLAPDHNPAPIPSEAPSNPSPSCASDVTWVDVVGGPSDLVVRKCWVVPSQPKQEDSMTFYATIANIGGSDAYNFRVDIYLDEATYESSTASLRAGDSSQASSRRSWTAEDGSHTVRWVVNSDRSVEESNYNNNEASCTFFVSQHTVTRTVTTTKTSTRTQTQRTETTTTVTRTTTRLYTTDTTITQTVNANPITVTETLSGLSTRTIYSPTVTITVAGSVQAGSNLFLWLAFSSLVMVGAVLQSPYSERLRRLCRKIAVLLPFPELLSWLAKRHVRKTLFALCLVSVAILSLTSQAGQLAFGSTVTSTRTTTSTEWTTISTTLTSTRYITSTSTDTSTFTRTSTSFTTVTPTVSTTIDERSTTTIYLPTTTWTTQRSASVSGGIVVLGVRAVCDSLLCLGKEPTKGLPFKLEIDLKNTDSVAHGATLSLHVSLPTRAVGWDAKSRTSVSLVQYGRTFQPGETATASFDITCYWNWIDPTIIDPVSIASQLVSAVSVGYVGSLVADSLLFGQELAYLSIALPDLTVSIVPQPGTNVPLATQTVKVRVHLFNLIMLGISIVAAAASLGLSIQAAAHFVVALIAAYPTGGISLGVPAVEFFTGFLLYLLSLEAYYFAKGDPDQNYKRIATAQNFTVPEIATINDTRSENLAREALTTFSNFNASLTSLGRFFSAADAGDTDYMVKQLQAAASFMEVAKERLDDVVANQRNSLSSSDLNATGLRHVKAWLAENGMPLFSKSTLEGIAGAGSSAAYLQSFNSTPDTLGVADAKNLLNTSDIVFQRFLNESRQETEKIRLQTGTPLLLYSYALLPVAVVMIAIYVIMTRRRGVSIRPPGGLFCRRCGVQNRLGTGFCRHCGTPLHRAGIPCRSCRTPNRPTASFCRRCGTRLH